MNIKRYVSRSCLQHFRVDFYIYCVCVCKFLFQPSLIFRDQYFFSFHLIIQGLEKFKFIFISDRGGGERYGLCLTLNFYFMYSKILKLCVTNFVKPKLEQKMKTTFLPFTIQMILRVKIPG